MVNNHTHILGRAISKMPRPKCVAKQPRPQNVTNRAGRADAGAHRTAVPLRAEARCCVGAVNRLSSKIKNEALH